MGETLQWTGAENTVAYDDDRVSIRSVYFPSLTHEQPATTRDGALVWVCGDIWGHDGSDGYLSRRESSAVTSAEFCARCYEEYGVSCAGGLNGNFAAVILDREERVAHLITDRLGTHPIYYAQPRPDTFVFSSLIQALPLYPSVDVELDVEYLCEYFALGSVGGIKTPISGISELLPSSVTSVDLRSGDVESGRYWQPKFEPIDKPFSYFVDRFVSGFEAALDDRLHPELTHGLLLSGGSDSRAILAGVDEDVDVHTYHATDWESRETRTADRISSTANRELRILLRDRGNHKRLLETTPPTMNFIGRFSEAHITGFGDRLREEVDVLISGLGADTLFRAHAFPTRSVDVKGVGTIGLPLVKQTRSVEEHIKRRSKPLPAYLDVPDQLDEILRRNLVIDDGTISHHGVVCDSVEELVFFDDFYPFSNKSDLFFHALNGMMPHWSPFFDNRLVDIALNLPLKHRLGRNLVDATTVALDESIASVPHGKTGVPPSQTFPMNVLQRYTRELSKRIVGPDEPPKPYLTHGPWVDTAELARSHEFVIEKLREKKPIIDALPFLDNGGVERCYEEHLNGENNQFELYTLLSFLHMPIVERAVEDTTNPQSTR